jgi:hypothetical protein
MPSVKVNINCAAKHCGSCPKYITLDQSRYCQLFDVEWQGPGMKQPIRTTYLEWDSEAQDYLRLSSCLEAEE